MGIMKPLTLSILLVSMLTSTVLSQTPNINPVPPIRNLGNFSEIGRDELIVYYVNTVDLVRTPTGALVETLGAHYAVQDGKPVLDNRAYLHTIWRIDCTARTGERLEDRGIWQGKKVHKTFSKPKIEKPTKERNLAHAIDAVCGDESPELTDKDPKTSYVWKGGNGCNLIGGGANEKACCVEHDFSYRTGGGERQRWQADSELFKCIWKRNKFLAPIVFVGARVGGLFAFHWGKRRKLERIPPPNAHRVLQ